MSHRCHAIDCVVEVPPRMLMCLRHWRMVPRATQEVVLSEYEPGQETRKDPSVVYLAVQRVAVGQVAERCGLSVSAAGCYAEAVAWLKIAKSAGITFRRPEHAEALNQALAAEVTVARAAAALVKRIRS